MGLQRAGHPRDDRGGSSHAAICALGGPWQAGDIAGRRAVVTGAAGWIGKAVAASLVRAGARVTVIDRDADRLAAEFGETCHRLAGSFDRMGEGRRLAEGVRRSAGEVELIVHNHEVSTSQDVLDLDEQGFNRAFNPREPFFFVRELARGLMAAPGGRSGPMAARGRIVFIAPPYADPFDQDASHVRARHACRSLTEVASGLWRLGIRANMIEPGWVVAGGRQRPGSSHLWPGWPGTPDDVARLTLCLLSEDCTRLVTGRAFGPEHWRPRSTLAEAPA